VTGQNSPLASAILLNSLPVSAAAKTGTAELKKGLYNNWIVVFAPYEEPEILLVLVVEKVKGLQAVTVPLAKSILEWYFTQKTK
jgi:penicillin-binding protein 2